MPSLLFLDFSFLSLSLSVPFSLIVFNGESFPSLFYEGNRNRNRLFCMEISFMCVYVYYETSNMEHFLFPFTFYMKSQLFLLKPLYNVNMYTYFCDIEREGVQEETWTCFLESLLSLFCKFVYLCTYIQYMDTCGWGKRKSIQFPCPFSLFEFLSNEIKLYRSNYEFYSLE